MSFPQQLSAHYDEIFAVNPDDMDFLAAHLTGKARLLDLGCGTGNKTVWFSTPNNAVTGIDLDESMIARAKEVNSRANVQYEILDMLDIDKRFPKSSFDGVICLGNSLALLGSPEAVQELLDKTYMLLTPGGAFALQILNYDRILDRNVTTLPDIETERAVFRRRYAEKDGALHFLTSLELKDGSGVFTSDAPVYPLRKEELIERLKSAGYIGLEFYGGFYGEPHDEDSFMTITLCRK